MLAELWSKIEKIYPHNFMKSCIFIPISYLQAC